MPATAFRASNNRFPRGPQHPPSAQHTPAPTVQRLAFLAGAAATPSSLLLAPSFHAVTRAANGDDEGPDLRGVGSHAGCRPPQANGDSHQLGLQPAARTARVDSDNDGASGDDPCQQLRH